MRTLFYIARRLRISYKKYRLQFHRQNILKQINGGDHLFLEGLINIIKPERLTIGKHVYIGADAYINSVGGITIGDYTTISRRATIYSYDHNFKNPSQLPFDSKEILKPVKIGKYVWIGMNVIIAPGTIINDGAVIGMGTVVSGNIPQNAIVVSAQTRIIGYRDATITQRLVQKELFIRR